MENEKSFGERIPDWLGIFILLGLYFGFFIFVRGKIPDADSLLSMISNLYNAYGYYIVFLGALLEGTFIVGLYLPGATVVLLGAALSKTGVVSFPIVLLMAIFGFMIGYTINYVLGKYGWYLVLNNLGLKKGLDVAKNKLKNNESKAIFLGFFHPSSAAFISTAAGVLKIPFKRFLLLSLISQIVWSLAWGSLAYIFGVALVELFLKYFGFVVLGMLAAWFLKRYFGKSKQAVEV